MLLLLRDCLIYGYLLTCFTLLLCMSYQFPQHPRVGYYRIMCISNSDLPWRCSAYGIFNLETIVRNKYLNLSVDCAKVVTQLYNPLKMIALLENSYEILGLRDLIYK